MLYFFILCIKDFFKSAVQDSILYFQKIIYHHILFPSFFRLIQTKRPTAAATTTVVPKEKRPKSNENEVKIIILLTAKIKIKSLPIAAATMPPRKQLQHLLEDLPKMKMKKTKSK